MVKKNVRHRECDSRPMSLPDDASAEELAQLAWAVAHPARVRIVRLLINRQACVCGEIVAELPQAQSTVSQHLKILKEFQVIGLVGLIILLGIPIMISLYNRKSIRRNAREMLGHNF